MKKREYPTRSILFFHSSKVGMRRLELPTSTSRTWRASQLCYIPFLITGAKIQLFFEMQIFFVLFLFLFFKHLSFTLRENRVSRSPDRINIPTQTLALRRESLRSSIGAWGHLADSVRRTETSVFENLSGWAFWMASGVRLCS